VDGEDEVPRDPSDPIADPEDEDDSDDDFVLGANARKRQAAKKGRKSGRKSSLGRPKKRPSI